jgi:formylmethanofuran dehydrogenase subunit E
MNHETVKMRPLQFSGIPVVCRHCGSVLYKESYKKGFDGSYLCQNCYSKIQKFVNR